MYKFELAGFKNVEFKSKFEMKMLNTVICGTQKRCSLQKTFFKENSIFQLSVTFAQVGKLLYNVQQKLSSSVQCSGMSIKKGGGAESNCSITEFLQDKNCGKLFLII